jgi:hypothetical protein
VGSWNSANHSFTGYAIAMGLWTDVAVSPDGSLIASLEGPPTAGGVAGAFWDANLHLLNATFYPDLALPDAPQSINAIFSATGHTLLVPTTDAIEFFDPATGRLRGRLLTPEALPGAGYFTQATPPGCIALDPTGQTIYAVSASGLTVMKLPTPVDQIGVPAWLYTPEVVATTNFSTPANADGVHLKRLDIRNRLLLPRRALPSQMR